MTICTEIIPGQFSSLGRQTERSLQKLRTHVEAADKEFQRSTAATPASREGKRDGKKKATSQETEEAADDAQMRKSASMKSLASVQSPTSPKSLMSTMTSLKSLKSMKSMASHVSVSSAASADADTTASSAALGDTADLSGSASPKPTPAFTSQGQDEGNFCETARALFGRFMHPNNIETPEAGHYRVSHSFTKVRSPLWEFGARSKHIPRKQREADCGMELGETWSSFSKAYEPGLRDGYLKLATSRPEPADACHYGMTFAPEHYGAWATLDAASSSSARQPAWDFKRHMHGHTADFAMNFPFFEPGKYNVKDQYTCVGMPFSKGLSRSQSAGEVSQDGLIPKSRMAPDRSLYRGCSPAVRRKTCVQDFSQDLDRPPLISASEVYFDEEDPDASQKALEWQLSFDASTASRAVLPRCMSPSLEAGLPRDRALRGARILGCDASLQRNSNPRNEPRSRLPRAMGIGLAVAAELGEPTLSDSICRERTDLGLAFKQQSGRYNVPSPLASRVHGSLRRPKDQVTFSFKRTSFPGFTSRSSVKRATSAPHLRPDGEPEVVQ